MTVHAHELASWCDIRVRAAASQEEPGFYLAVAVTERLEMCQRLVVTTYSRNPHMAVAHALRELAAALEAQ